MKWRLFNLGWVLLALGILAGLVFLSLTANLRPRSHPFSVAAARPAATPGPGVASAGPTATPTRSAPATTTSGAPADVSPSATATIPFSSGAISQNAATIADALTPGVDLSDPSRRAAAVERVRAVETRKKAAAVARAKQLGIPERIERPDGTVVELMGFDGDKPIYFLTHNANAAISTGANLMPAAPYSVTGTGITIGEWDAGGVRTTHQEFGGRVTIRDGASLVDHSTHVGGTLAAAGVVAAAKGMAPSANVDSYEWNSDKAEMTARGASYPGEAGMLPLSNQSYGEVTGWYYTGLSSPMWAWYGTGTTTTGTDGDFGKYETNCRDTDALAVSLPYFLMFRSAGNDRGDNPSAGDAVSLSTSTSSGSVVTYDPGQHPAGDGSYRGGYDTISFDAGAKDIVTVGAVNDAVSGGVRSAAAGTMTSFSSWGPTDDGRIKPDIVANGAGLYSTLSTSDTAYGTYSGTSMASPNAAGSAALLVGYFDKLFPGQAMRASTLKALLIHTADDLGAAGPDYQSGWGLINVKAAADVIKAYKTSPGTHEIVEDQVTTSVISRSYPFTWDGVSPIRATLSWIDPAGTATTSADSRTARLVNNLDLAITDPNNAAHQPYVMPYVGDWTAAKLSAVATTGKNNVDNVEQVYLAAPPAAGVYTAVVTFSGTLTTSAQRFSLVITGGTSTATAAAPTVTAITPNSGSSGTTVATITGGNFALGATVKLTRTGQADVAASGVEVVSDTIKCRFALDGLAAGQWNVVVTNPDGQSATLANVFTIASALWSENFEGGGVGWTHSASVGSTTNWALGTTQSHSTSHAMAGVAPATRNVDDLYAPAINIPVGAANLRLTFWHYYAFSSTRAGGTLEFSLDGGTTWFDVTSASSGAAFATGGYTGTLAFTGSSQTRNPLAGQSAWTGNNSGFTQAAVDITDAAKYAGKTLRIRWRLSTGQTQTSNRWYVDDVALAGSVPAQNLAPSITTAAFATPTTVTGSTAQLQVAATDDGGEAGLTYTWTASGEFGTSVQFSENGTHAASATTATFAKAGAYTIAVTVRDAEGLTATSETSVTVAQTGTQLTLTPTSATLAKGGTQAFSAQAFDQFGVAMVTPPTFVWSTDGGSIDASGLFTAGATTGNFTVSVALGVLSESADVTITGERLETWRAAHFSAGEASGNAQDFDGDGLSNLVEYALGSDPRVINASPAVTLESGYLTMNFSRPRALPDVSYAAEVSSDLVSWTTLPLEIVTDGEVQAMRARDTMPSDGASRRFLRLRVTPVVP